jgi:subtilase family serine protease
MRMVKLLLPALLIASLFSSLSYAAVPDRIPGALTSGATVTLKGNIHRKALPQYDQGPADPSLRLGYMTLLTVPTAAQRKALTQLLADQQNRKSPNYHKWLTPEQWADRFGLSHGDVQKLTDWLKSQGFSVGSVARGRNWITFGGTAAQVQTAFGTEMRRYNVDGEMHVANATAPRIPAALSGIVTGLRGLHDFHLKPSVVKNTRAAARGARPGYYDPIFTNQNPAAPSDFLSPGDIATLYDINALYNATTPIDGTNQKIAVAGQTDIYLADLNDFRSGFGLSQFSGCTTDSTTGLVIAPCNTTNFQYVLVLPSGLTDPLTPSLGDLTEADLDIEWSGAVARNAQIIYVNSPLFFSGSTYLGGGVFNAWYYAVDQNLAPVISLSYGNCEFNDNFILDATGLPLSDEIELMKANSQGITFLNSSGDSGAAECDGPTNSTTNPVNLAVGGLAVSYPASSPEVTGVGGTAVAYPSGFAGTYWGTTNATDGGSALAYAPETAWNDDEELVAAYGGTAASWQQSFAIVATGGGPSVCAQQTSDNASCVAGFGRPSWQNVTISGPPSSRFSPDVSLAASPNFPGYIFCTPQNAWISGSTNTASTCVSGISAALALTDSSNQNTPSLVGGTSASTPTMAGIVALLNQEFGPLGNINPTLYALAATPSNGVFHHVTTGDNNVYCQVGTPVAPWPTALQCPAAGLFGYSATAADATTGYNLVTGLGSVDANNLVTQWNSAPAAEFTLTPTVSNFQVTQGSPINVTVNVAVAGGTLATPITFACTDTAPASTCTVPPSTSTSGQVSFAITTTAATAELRRPSDRGSRIFYAALLPGLLGIMLIGGSRRRSLRGMRFLGLIVALGFSTLWLASCGGSNSKSNSNPGTTKGTYTISVTGTSGASTATTSFQVIVQ